MATVQQNVAAVQAAYDEVKNHCMCLAIHDDGCIYRVIYPAGMALDGVQCCYLVTGKLVALQRMLARMEKDWQEGVPQ